jgi:RNA polymerase sigma-70 factor (ECF subfamily)
MRTASPHDDDTVALAAAWNGDEAVFADLFNRHRKRLKLIVKARLDARLAGRIDADDVLQEVFLEAFGKLPQFNRQLPLFLWLRLIVGEKLIDLHRHHLGVQMRDAGREVSLFSRAMPVASSVGLAEQLAASITSPSLAAVRNETKLQVQQALELMDPLDHEVVTLRSFELLSNSETAAVLSISQQAASNRYVRALKRMKDLLVVARGNQNAKGNR